MVGRRVAAPPLRSAATSTSYLTGPEVDGHRPQDRLLVVDDEDPAHAWPPAGRSSRSCRRRACPRSRSSPPSPRGTRGRPRGRAEPLGSESPRRWNGWNTRWRSAGRMPRATVDDRSSHVTVAFAGLDADPLAVGGEADGVVTTLAIARSSRAGSASTAEASRERRCRRRHRRGPSCDTRPDDVLQRRRRQRRLHDTGLHPAHVEQVGDERGQAVGFRVDRLDEVGDLVVGPAHVTLTKARRTRLDRCERRAQIVGDRCSRATRNSLDSASPRAARLRRAGGRARAPRRAGRRRR